MNRPFEESLILGQIGENTVQQMLRQRGINIENNASALMSKGRGPAVETDVGAIPRPDFTLSLRGVSCAAEIKTKTNRTCGKLTNQIETGIDFTKWNDYKDYTKATGAPVLLFFVEYTDPIAASILKDASIQAQFEAEKRVTATVWPIAVFGQWLDRLVRSLPNPTPIRGREMVFFAIDQFLTLDGCVTLFKRYVDQHSTSLV